MGTFRDIDAAVREACQALLESPLIPYKESIRGFVYDVGEGTVREVDS